MINLTVQYNSPTDVSTGPTAQRRCARPTRDHFRARRSIVAPAQPAATCSPERATRAERSDPPTHDEVLRRLIDFRLAAPAGTAVGVGRAALTPLGGGRAHAARARLARDRRVAVVVPERDEHLVLRRDAA